MSNTCPFIWGPRCQAENRAASDSPFLASANTSRYGTEWCRSRLEQLRLSVEPVCTSIPAFPLPCLIALDFPLP